MFQKYRTCFVVYWWITEQLSKPIRDSFIHSNSNRQLHLHLHLQYLFWIIFQAVHTYTFPLHSLTTHCVSNSPEKEFKKAEHACNFRQTTECGEKRNIYQNASAMNREWWLSDALFGQSFTFNNSTAVFIL